MKYKLLGTPKLQAPLNADKGVANSAAETSKKAKALQKAQDKTQQKGNRQASVASSENWKAIDFPITVPEAILIYLACCAGSVERETLAELLFENVAPHRKLPNFRANLSKVRTDSERPWISDCIKTNDKTIELLSTCDVLDFEKAIQDKRYEDALNLYHGEFLAGYSGVDTAPAFKEWVYSKRLDLQNQRYVATREYAQALADADKMAEAIDWISKLLQDDVLHVQAIELCEFMLSLALQKGEALRALNCFNDYKRALKVALEDDEAEAEEGLEHLAEQLTELSRKPPPIILGTGHTATTNNTLSKKHHIPAQATHFIGRENEIKVLIGQFLNANTRMISLIGYGGIGKTRLAVETATTLQDHYTDGVFVIELVAIQSVDNIPSTINTVLGIKTEIGESPEDALDRVLQDKQLLLVLDNFEHLLEGRDLVDSLLGNNSNVDIIVTSRERLNLSWEYVHDIEGLTYPRIKNPDLVYPKDSVEGAEGEAVPENILENETLPETAEDIAEFESYDAIKLFERSATARVKDFSITDNKVAVQQICSFVEGLPLGIELAASWVSSLSCEMIAETLQKDVTGIKTRLKDVPDRHKSLDVVFEHSWGLLDEQQQEVLAKTAIFQGGFDSRAAEAVIGTTFADLAELCEKSLVRIDDNGRYSLHEVIRQNAVGKLVRAPKIHSVTKTAHQKYYMDFVESCDYFELSDNLENIEVAWLNVIKSYQPNSDNLDVATMFQKIYVSQAMTKRAIIVLNESLELLQFRKKQIDCKLLEANLIRLKAYFLAELGFSEEALKYEEMVFQIAKELNEPKLLINAYHRLAISYEYLGKLTEASNLIKEGLIKCSYENHKALLLGALARIQSKIGGFNNADKNYNKAITIYQKLDSKEDIIRTKNNYSYLLLNMGRYQEAKKLIIETLNFSENNGIKSTQDLLYKKLAEIHVKEENYVQAWSMAQQALAICNEEGTKYTVVQITAVLADIALATSNIPLAKNYFLEALKISLEVKTTDGKYMALIGLAKIHVSQNEKSEAIQLLSGLMFQTDLRSSLKTSVTNILEELKNASSKTMYLKAFQNGNIEFVNKYCVKVLNNF